MSSTFHSSSSATPDAYSGTTPSQFLPPDSRRSEAFRLVVDLRLHVEMAVAGEVEDNRPLRSFFPGA
jgi:hypothetical protein